MTKTCFNKLSLILKKNFKKCKTYCFFCISLLLFVWIKILIKYFELQTFTNDMRQPLGFFYKHRFFFKC